MMSLRIRASVADREIGSRCLLATVAESDALTSTSTRHVTMPPSTASMGCSDCSGEQVQCHVSWLLRPCVCILRLFFGYSSAAFSRLRTPSLCTVRTKR